jgi:uncharacterized protein YjbI with pentapeptide repeats
MANNQQLAILKQGVDVWNKWRDSMPLLTSSPSYSFIDLPNVGLRGTNLEKINLGHANLREADFRRTNLDGANFEYTNLIRADFTGAELHAANLSHADLQECNFTEAQASKSNFYGSNLEKARLSGAMLGRADLRSAKLRGASLRGAYLSGADLSNADLRGADLREANLRGAVLLGSKIAGTRISRSSVYGISVWDLKGEFADQEDLVITPAKVSIITVDNVKVAQFIYLILNNSEIRDVIDTITSKSILILGRFAIPERKAILDTLKDKLRAYDLLPIVFDFDRPTNRDFTETIKTLAGLSYFVIADITNPKSSPLELQATVPDYQIPLVPIIQEGESPFAMMIDLQNKYNWVLDTVSYDSEETLMKVLKPLIIDPAMKKRQELRIIKAHEPEIISGKDFLAKGGS